MLCIDISIRKESSNELALLRIIYEMDVKGEQATLWSILAAAEKKKCLDQGTDEDKMNNSLREMAMKGFITTKPFDRSKDGYDLTIFPTIFGLQVLNAEEKVHNRCRTNF